MSQTPGKVVLRRDRIGLEPLFFGLSRDGQVLRSGLARELQDVVAADAFLPPRTRTTVRGVGRVPPAHEVEVVGRHVRCRRYWSPASVGGPSVACADAPKTIRRVATQVARTLVEDVGDAGMAVHASGGIDSAAYAALVTAARREAGWDDPVLVSWSPPPRGRPFDEQDRVLRLADALQLDVLWVDLDVSHVVEAEQRREDLDPVETGLWEAVAARRVAAQGLQVVVSGWGGDETVAFNGRGWHTERLLSGRIDRLIRSIPERRRAFGGTLKGAAAWTAVRTVRPLLADHVAERWGLLPSAGPTAPPTRLQERSVRGMQEWALTSGHLARRIESWHIIAHDHGLTYRYPALAWPLVELALRMHPDAFFHDGWIRWAFRQAFVGLVPDEILWHTRKVDRALEQRREDVWAAYQRRSSSSPT